MAAELLKAITPFALDTAYYLFHYKGWSPGEFYGKPPGERLVLTAFAEREAETRWEHPEFLRCPFLRG